jgi:hypothetical protein
LFGTRSDFLNRPEPSLNKICNNQPNRSFCLKMAFKQNLLNKKTQMYFLIF